MNHNGPAAITEGLRLRGVDVLTAAEDGRHQLDDPALLDRASQLGRVLFTMDRDLLMEASKRQRAGASFSGVVFAHQLAVSIGRCVEDLELLARATTSEELRGLVQHLPL